MAQVSDPLPPDHGSPILCEYENETDKIQVARITNIPNWYFERVVFPGQRLTFEAPPEAILEIQVGMMASAILAKTISCESLKADQFRTSLEAEAGIAWPDALKITLDLPDDFPPKKLEELVKETVLRADMTDRSLGGKGLVLDVVNVEIKLEIPQPTLR